MATRNPFLVNWVKAAYSMEMGLVPVLEKQASGEQGDPELRNALDRHLQATRRHVQLLRDHLQMLGETPSAVHPATPIAAAFGQADGNAIDRTQQTELIDYVTEAYESASYQALKNLAERLGDQDTGMVCDQILQDEMAMSAALDRRLRSHDGTEGFRDRASVNGKPLPNLDMARERAGTSGGQDYAAMALATFDALNARDLYRWARDFAPDFRGEGPGAPGEMTTDQNRAWIEGYMTAFPDMHFDIERTVSDGEQVVVYWLCTGTNSGPMMAPNGMTIPPTGKTARVRGNSTFDFKDDRILRGRVLFDTGDLMQQLGLMPGAATNKEGQPNREVVHIEIPARDRKAAADFYHKMFGWDYENMDAMQYTTFKTGNIGGGFADVSDLYQPGGSVPYVGSEDIDADLRRAESMGAQTIIPKTEIPGMGYFAIFSDPTGNRFGLFSS